MTSIDCASDLKDNLNNFIITNIILFAIFVIGLYFQIKLVVVSKQEKDMTWRIDISHSIIMIIYFGPLLLFEIITSTNPSLHRYTGEWVCYVAIFVQLYTLVSAITHSLAISIYKYIFIVHQRSIHNFGADKAHLIAFWVYLIFPGIFATSVIARPELPVLSFRFTCLGLQDQYNTTMNKTDKKVFQTVLFCGFDEFQDDDSIIGYVMNIVNSIGCFLQIVLCFLMMANIMEGFFYRKTFVYMKR